VSILPAKLAVGVILHQTVVRLTAANGSSIPVHGETSIEFAIPDLRRKFTWTFVVADTSNALLGADFLSNFRMVVDCGNKKLIDGLTVKSARVFSVNSQVTKIIINDSSNQCHEVRNLLNKYPYLTSPRNINDLANNKPKIYHRIETGDSPPVYCKIRQLHPEKENAAKNEYGCLMSAGIMRRSESSWSSALHVVPKTKPGEWRPVGDYRALNSITKPDRYPIPNIWNVTSKLHGMSVFSKLDLSRAYHHIPIHPDDVEKTAVSTSFGMYEFLYMPFGLRNAAATFQRFVDSVFFKCKCVFVYLDDILVFSKDESQHIKDLDEVLNILSDNNMKLCLDKCSFLQTKLDFLGCELSANGVSPSKKKLYEIGEFPQPTNSKSLRSFLGLVNFYRRLIPNFATIVFPLTELIKKFPNEKKLNIPDNAVDAFNKIKLELSSVAALPYPETSVSHYQLVTDSSSFAIGAALHQIVNNQAIPIGFFSKKLSDSQKKYSAYDRELLAAYLSVLHFKPMIEGRNVTLFTDHKTLATAFKSLSPAKSDRQQRHLAFLTEYVADVQYIRGDQNVVADCLSRPVNAVSLDLTDLPALAEAQLTDNETKENSHKLKSYNITPDKILWCDVSTQCPRPFIPFSARESIFNQFHAMSHPGIKSTVKMIKSRYFYPNMDRDIRERVRQCESCQQAKILRHTKSEVCSFNLPAGRFEAVHIDIVGPLPAARQFENNFTSNYRYLLTCVDRATRWIEAVPLVEITASTVAVAFLETWVSRFGVPLHVLTDRGAQFESELFKKLASLTGFDRLRTTSYHPQTNGMVERVHKTVKTSVMAKNKSWLVSLPIVLLSIRSIQNDSGYSPFTAVTGGNLFIPRVIVEPEIEKECRPEAIAELSKAMASIDFQNLSLGTNHSSPKPYVPADLKDCSHVWLRIDRVRRSLEAPYSGPFEVVKRLPKIFVIKVGANEQTVSIDRLKPAVLRRSTSSNATPVASTKPDTEETIREDSRNLVDSDKIDVPKINVPKINVPASSRSGRKIKFNPNPDYVFY